MTTRFGFVSTYPPTQCGLATFTAALYGELVTDDSGSARVVRLVDAPQSHAPQSHASQSLSARPRSGESRSRPEVAGHLVAGEPGGAFRAAHLLADSDVAIVQHEYGVYGGADGDEVLHLLRALTIPSIVVLHTVLSAPTRHQRQVLEAVTESADAVVTMTATARDRLAGGYDVDMSKVTVIPHGAPLSHGAHGPLFRTAQPTVLTWGLIGPGKGIEWGVEAMARLTDLDPAPRYVVAGQTHPKVLLHEGEAYRRRLMALTHELRLEATVSFDSHYRHNDALRELVRSADVVLLPYDSRDQVTSGVLIEAVAAGKPVVATRFPHAVELLGDGAGLLVPHQDPAAIADALRLVLTRRDMAADMAKAGQASSSQLHWPAVAERYRALAVSLIGKRVAA